MLLHGLVPPGLSPGVHQLRSSLLGGDPRDPREFLRQLFAARAGGPPGPPGTVSEGAGLHPPESGPHKPQDMTVGVRLHCQDVGQVDISTLEHPQEEKGKETTAQSQEKGT